jgi:uncharacterized protein (TIGR02231 family)
LESKLTSVTVFPRGAEINRSVEISLEPGAHTLTIGSLPSSVIANSIRVEGETDGKLEIGSVDSRSVVTRKTDETGPDASERNRIEKEIDALNDQIKAQQWAIDAAVVQKELAQNLTKTPVNNWRQSLQQTEGAAMPDWNGLFDLIATRLTKIHANIQESEIRKRELDEQISVLRRRLTLQPTEQTLASEVAIHVEAASALKGHIKLRYQVNNASWTPFYDARLTTGVKGGDAALALVRRAEINQSTGEDWDDVELTLSTTRPGGATAAPDLAAEKVDFLQDASTPFMARRFSAPAPSRGEEDGAADLGTQHESYGEAAKPSAPAAKKKAAETGAAVEHSSFQAVFRVPGRASIKTGMGAKKLFILTEDIKPSLTFFTAPKKDPTAYLSVKFAHASEAPLLAGAVSLYRDGVYIGQGALPLVAKGEEHELGFGADDAVKVKRLETRRSKSETGMIASSTIDARQYKITVKNLHSWPARVTVIDQHPYAEEDKIVVTLLPETTEPTVRNRDDKRGVLAWTFEAKPGEEREITLAYDIRWPAKREVYTSEAPK